MVAGASVGRCPARSRLALVVMPDAQPLELVAVAGDARGLARSRFALMMVAGGGVRGPTPGRSPRAGARGPARPRLALMVVTDARQTAPRPDGGDRCPADRASP